MMEADAVSVAAARTLAVVVSVSLMLNPMTFYGTQYDVLRRNRPPFLSWSMVHFACGQHVFI
jgi:hypothetical protein